MPVRESAGGNFLPVENPAFVAVDKDGVPVFGGGFSSPIAGYQVSDIDDPGTGTAYFGFLAADGKWLIKRVTATQVRFASGDASYQSGSGYPAAFTGRAGLTYLYFNEVF